MKSTRENNAVHTIFTRMIKCIYVFLILFSNKSLSLTSLALSNNFDKINIDIWSNHNFTTIIYYVLVYLTIVNLSEVDPCKLPVVNLLWSSYCGQLTVFNLLWSNYCGQLTVVNLPCGQITVVKLPVVKMHCGQITVVKMCVVKFRVVKLHGIDPDGFTLVHFTISISIFLILSIIIFDLVTLTFF